MTDVARADSRKKHFTTRRGFVAACGFGIVGLYGLWAAYGAAPVPFLGGSHEPLAGGGGGAAHRP